jgi:hypothetical protein
MTLAMEPSVGMFITYPIGRFALRSCVANALGLSPVNFEFLHVGSHYPLFDRASDQSTSFHKAFYAGFSEYVESTYVNLVREVIRPRYAEPIVYQRIPTFRVHLPGNVAVGEFHRDRDYMHSEVEENYWLPLTACWGNNSLWVETAPGREDFQPVKMEYGQILKFDGANLKHGNRVNDTQATRVSMDFRVVPLSKYSDSERQTINTKMRFAIGGYFNRMP